MRSVVAAPLALVVIAAACATGDGRELQSPTEPAPTTTEAPHTDGPVEFPSELPSEFSQPGPDDVPIDPPPPFEVFAAWRDGAEMSDRHTCDGADVSPALTWTGAPDGTVEIAITVIDEQADGFVHWVVTGIDPASVSTLEGQVPPGAVEHENGFGDTGWGGPCPPEGATHTYRFTVHALDHELVGIDDVGSASAAVALIESAALESTSVTGTFGR